MTEISPPDVRFTGPEEGQLVRYRELSKLALLALLFGLASVLSLVNPLLLLIPVAGVVCAIVAMRTIRANPEELTGVVPAVIGLGLSLFFFGWGAGWTTTRPGRLSTHAQQFAADWLQLVQQNRLFAAHQLRQDPSSRAPLTSRLDDFYRAQPPELFDSFAQFERLPLVQALLQAGPSDPPEFVGVASVDHSGAYDSVKLRYRLQAKQQPTPWNIQITASRDGNGEWQIGNVDGKQGDEWPE